MTPAQFQQVMSNLTALFVTGEYIASTPGLPSTFEVAGLDNVMLTPEPEPSASVLMTLGLVGVAWAARRRLQTAKSAA